MNINEIAVFCQIDLPVSPVILCFALIAVVKSLFHSLLLELYFSRDGCNPRQPLKHILPIAEKKEMGLGISQGNSYEEITNSAGILSRLTNSFFVLLTIRRTPLQFSHRSFELLNSPVKYRATVSLALLLSFLWQESFSVWSGQHRPTPVFNTEL